MFEDSIIRRLKPQETQQERLNNFDEIPQVAPLWWVTKYLQHQGIKRDNRTFIRWRQLLLENCSEYQGIAIASGLDTPSLTRRQIQLLQEFGHLVIDLKSTKLAIAQYNLNHPSPYD